MSSVIVVWAGESPSSLPALEEKLDAVVVPLDAALPLNALPASLTRGGLVAVVPDAEAAERALSLGADEVLRADRARAELAAAIGRARLRAAARAVREARLLEEMSHTDSEALELLVAAIAHELRTPLAVALLNSEMLREAIGAVAGVADEIARWATDPAPPPAEEVRRLLAMRFTAPPTSEIDAIADDLVTSLHRATLVIKKMSALTIDGGPDHCDLSAALWKVEALMRGVIERTAAFVVDVPPSSLRIATSSPQLVQTIAALLANAQQACVDRGGQRQIELRLIPHEQMGVIEVKDDGVGMDSEVRRRAQNPFFTTRRPGALGLGLTIASARVRRAGGEVMIESETLVGTCVRVFFPVIAADAAADEAAGGDEN